MSHILVNLKPVVRTVFLAIKIHGFMSLYMFLWVGFRGYIIVVDNSEFLRPVPVPGVLEAEITDGSPGLLLWTVVH